MSGSFYQMFVTLRNGESMNLRNIYINKYVKMCRGGGKTERTLISTDTSIYSIVYRNVVDGIFVVLFCEENLYMAE